MSDWEHPILYQNCSAKAMKYGYILHPLEQKAIYERYSGFTGLSSME